MIAAWDALVRAWLVVRVWIALRRTRDPALLARIRDPKRFARAAIVPAGRQLALAIAFLPRRHRTEATVAFIACNALHALDERSLDPVAARHRIAAAVAYLVGEASAPPRIARRGYPDIGAVLAARLPLVRAALDALPGDAARRCGDIIERFGDGLVRTRADRGRHADHAHGEAVVHALRLVAPTVRPPVGACWAAGRAIPLAAELAAAADDRARDAVLDRRLPALAFVPRLLRWLPTTIGPGGRAAITLMATTTYPFTTGELDPLTAHRLRRPLRAALAAACSRRSFLATVAAIEEVVDRARAGLLTRLDRPILGGLLSRVPEALTVRALVTMDPVVPDAGAEVAAPVERAS